jgi:hypothetical protein
LLENLLAHANIRRSELRLNESCEEALRRLSLIHMR